MATKRQKKKAYNTTKKIAKKYPIIFIVILIIIIALGVTAFILYNNGYFDKWFNKNSNNNNQSNEIVYNEDGYNENIIYDNFQIHFMELNNEYAGDSTYIKAGDVDILIDAGSRGNSAPTLVQYIKQYCTDGKLEYVISTHNHQDHIAGFAGNSDSKATNYKGNKVGKTGVLYYFDVGTFIDFTYAGVTQEIDGKKKTVTYDNKNQVSSSFASGTEYGKYLAAREYIISNGAKYYTATDLWDSNNTKFELADGITMDILYNYYYFNESSDVNNYSVCTLFNYNDHHFLLTGDLELEGEEKLVEYYNGSSQDKTLPKCELFKAGHHGSETSSNECLLEIIQPKICVACCCAGNTEYTVVNDTIFPTQGFINRIAKYTSRVYVTTLFEQSTGNFVSMNGNIIVSSNGTNIGLRASNNLIRLKDTEWFNEKVYLVDGKIAKGNKGSKDFYKSTDSGVVEKPRRVWPTNGKE